MHKPFTELNRVSKNFAIDTFSNTHVIKFANLKVC